VLNALSSARLRVTGDLLKECNALTYWRNETILFFDPLRRVAAF
jgi:hypothetical protein